MLCLVSAWPLSGQSSQKLKSQRERIQSEIKELDQALTASRSREKETLKQLELLERKLRLREEAITLLQKEVDSLQTLALQLDSSSRAAGLSAGKALDTYRRLARYRVYHRLQGFDPIWHFLAAPALDVAFRRMFHFDRLATRRRESARAWRAESVRLDSLRAEKVAVSAGLQEAIAEEERQKTQAELERQERSNLLRQLRRNAEALKADLQRKQAEREKLERAIADMIRKEIAEAEARERAKAKPKAPAAKGSPPASSGAKSGKTGGSAPTTADLPLTPEGERISGDFTRQKGKLPWPVDRASVVRPYGRQSLPDLPQVVIDNTGVDLRTEPGASVKAIFEGTVSGIQWVPGHAYVLFIRHGKYYSVYSDLEAVRVKKGDNVRSGAVIGTAAKDPLTGHGEIHFEIWNGKSRQNPSHWLSTKR